MPRTEEDDTNPTELDSLVSTQFRSWFIHRRMEPKIELLDARLSKRCWELVRRHCVAVARGAAGSSLLPGGALALAQTMAA